MLINETEWPPMARAVGHMENVDFSVNRLNGLDGHGARSHMGNVG